MRSSLHDRSAIFFLSGPRSSTNEGSEYVLAADLASSATEFVQAQFERAGPLDRTRADRLASAITRALMAANGKAG